MVVQSIDDPSLNRSGKSHTCNRSWQESQAKGHCGSQTHPGTPRHTHAHTLAESF
jgi:hypothetical protein